MAGATQDASGVDVTIDRGGRSETRRGRYLIGADGASSTVRRSLGIEFEGFTWPDRLLVVSTPFDFNSVHLRACRRSATWPIRSAGISCCKFPGCGASMFLVNEDASDERVQTQSSRNR